MKRFIIGTALILVVVVALIVTGLCCPALCWLLVLSGCLYLAFGRKADIEFRAGVGQGGDERRLYAALVWKHAGKAVKEAEDSSIEPVSAEERV